MGSKQRPALLPKRPTDRSNRVPRPCQPDTTLVAFGPLHIEKLQIHCMRSERSGLLGGNQRPPVASATSLGLQIDRSQIPCAKRSVVVRRSRGEIAGCEEKRRLVSSEIICRSESTPIAEAFRLPFAGTLTGRAPRGGDSSGGDAAVTTAALSSTPYHKNILITILGGGSLGSCVDEERSKMREQM